MYEGSWGSGISISETQIASMISNFSEGQIVGIEKGYDEPVSMINIMLGAFDPGIGFRGGYDALTGGRTFTTHQSIDRIAGILEGNQNIIVIAYCVSIVAERSHARNGFAADTLNYAISFAEKNGFLAVPYSAPRGFSDARKVNPNLGIMPYLHLTKPAEYSYQDHLGRLDRLNGLSRVMGAFRSESKGSYCIMEVSSDVFSEYKLMKADPLDCSADDTVYSRFLLTDGARFQRIYGRSPTIEDFCLLSGRKLLDPTMRMHVENGARFIRNDEGKIIAVFENSRPQDTASYGYNIVLTYGYHPYFGHPFMQ